MASTRKSAVFRAGSKSSTKGTERLCSWVLRRWLGLDFLLFFLLLRSFWFGIAYFVKLLFALLWVVQRRGVAELG